MRNAKLAERRGEAIRTDDTKQVLNQDLLVFYLRNPNAWQKQIDELTEQGGMEMEAAEVYGFKDWYESRNRRRQAA